ncbi:MAG: substrate-binding domain-containing protein [Luteolibacter sp.]|jgi:DNA-binding LacI/PurR family transcriptional regulator
MRQTHTDPSKGEAKIRFEIRASFQQVVGMSKFEVLTAAEQVAKHLREEIARGTWTGMMPGEDRLMARLGVGRNTIKTALKRLENDGWLEGRGAGRRRRIAMSNSDTRAAPRIRILLYEKIARGSPDIIELISKLQEAGFVASFAPKTLQDLGMKSRRVADFVAGHPADAWVVMAGSREVLTWFSTQPFPVLAMYGRFTGLPIAAAAPRKIPAMLNAVRQLVALGHRRIVMLAREDRRKPVPGLAEQALFDELVAHGIPIGPYNLPDWDNSRAGLHDCLHSLFDRTPPSALIIGDTVLYSSVQQFLASRGILVPKHVSLLCLDPDHSFAWCDPVISHIDWDYHRVVRRVLKWAENVARGREDRQHQVFEAKLMQGGTIGAVGK